MGYWIVVVDDDVVSLKTARLILAENGMRVSSVRSGAQFLEFMKNNRPDLVLLDIVMPEMDGFETYRRLKEQEKEMHLPATPVIFMTGGIDGELERKGLEMGASDFMKKPFAPDVLVHRIDHTIGSSKKIRGLIEEANTDQLTGFLNRSSVIRTIREEVRRTPGALMILDMDSFKLVNDLYGHDMGDRMLVAFAELLRQHTRSEDIIGRIGGDEFLCFCRNISEETVVKKLTDRVNEQLIMEARRLMGEDFSIPIGVSAGTVIVTRGGDYDELFARADKALYYVKQNGKHGYALYEDNRDNEAYSDANGDADMERLTQILDERGEASNALWLGQDAFINVYRFLLRFLRSYHGTACKAIFTLKPVNIEFKGTRLNALTDDFGTVLKTTLRMSDLMMQTRTNQFFVLFPELTEEYVDNVVQRILSTWEKTAGHEWVEIIYDFQPVECGSDDLPNDGGERRTRHFAVSGG